LRSARAIDELELEIEISCPNNLVGFFSSRSRALHNKYDATGGSATAMDD
jgi:hypothetical protein